MKNKKPDIFLTQFLCQAICTQRPEGTQVIVGSMNMGYISDTARNRTHNLFRPKREPIPLGHNDVYVIMWYWTMKLTIWTLADAPSELGIQSSASLFVLFLANWLCIFSRPDSTEQRVNIFMLKIQNWMYGNLGKYCFRVSYRCRGMGLQFIRAVNGITL